MIAKTEARRAAAIHARVGIAGRRVQAVLELEPVVKPVAVRVGKMRGGAVPAFLAVQQAVAVRIGKRLHDREDGLP